MSAAPVSAPLREERSDLPLWWAISLHLLPGIGITLFYLLTAPLLGRANVPLSAAIYLAILVVLVPLELGCLLYLGKRRNGRFSLKGIVRNVEPTPLPQMLWLVPVVLIWSIIVFMVLGVPLDRWVTQRFLFWLPDLFQPAAFGMTAAQLAHSRTVLLAVWAGAWLLNGIAGPVVEECYFRGYLLPRMAALGRWAPLVNVLLFSLYHFFSPFQNVSRILALIPMVYVVWWKRNIRISMWAHCLLNTGFMVMTLPTILQYGR